MKLYIWGIIIYILPFFSSQVVYCRYNEKPFSFSYQSNNLPLTNADSIDFRRMATFNIDSVKSYEDSLELSNSEIPFRFGYEFKCNLNLQNSGTWDSLDDGGRLWRLRIISHAAYSINLLFSEFNLPEGAKLFFYNNDSSMCQGAFTSLNNNSYHKFPSDLIKGENIIIEYYEPAISRNLGELTIESIIHAYINLYNDSTQQGITVKGKNQNQAYTECNVDVSCPEGDDWCLEKRSVSRIIYNFRIIGTGTLLNILPNFDINHQYLLTSLEILDDKPVGDDDKEIDYPTETDLCPYLVFWFKYYHNSCDGTTDNHIVSNGATYKGSYTRTGFMLLELNTPFSVGDDIYFAGWAFHDPITEAAPIVSMLHVPSIQVNQPMRLFVDDQTALSILSEDDPSPSWGNIFWQVNPNKYAGIDVGSKGAAFFNVVDSKDHKVIGQACDILGSGGVYCNKYAIGGKLSYSWEGGGTDETSLHHWLDNPWTNGNISCDGYFLGSNELTHYGEQINEEYIDNGAGSTSSNFDIFHYGKIKIGSGGSGQINTNWEPYILMINKNTTNSSPTYINDGYPTLQMNVEMHSRTLIHIRPCSFITAGVNFHAYIGGCSGNSFNNVPNSPPRINTYPAVSTNYPNDFHPNIYAQNIYYCNGIYSGLEVNTPDESNVNFRIDAIKKVGLPNIFPDALDAIPNPSDASVKIKYAISQPSYCNITISNELGEMISTVVDSPNIKTGGYSLDFDTSKLPAGTYFITMRTLNNTITKQIVVIH
ncbi:MAG: T9SS type A sorting domain-containing protein [Candidatus Kapabacteria bacterium]|nr:T9SS type A sorting domain-containing protein [Candidatus Kapabacteria bacterium]